MPFIALIIVVFIFALGTPTRVETRRGNEAFDRAQEDAHRRNREYAQKNDLYFEQSKLVTLDINENFYSDGSLRHDSATNRNFAKGQYYVDSRGQMANRSYDHSKQKPE